MLLHAVFAVVAAITASSSSVLAQYPPNPPVDPYASTLYSDTGVPYDPTYSDTVPYAPAPYQTPDLYGPVHPEPYPPPVGDQPPEPYPVIVEPKPDYPPAAYDYSLGYGHGYGSDAFSQLRQQVLDRIAAIKASLAEITAYRIQTLASIDKITTLSTAWCRSM